MATLTPITPITPDIQKQLYDETDVRFWAQTGYKPGKKLDPKNPLDAKMITTYTGIYNKVKREWETKSITWTLEDPAVQSNLALAHAAGQATAQSMDHAAAAVAENRHQDAAQHLADAQTSHAAGAVATTAAAYRQPFSLSHEHVEHAAREIRRFIMDALGRGVPVSNGADMTAAMQGSAAPARAAEAAASSPTPAPATPAPLPDFTTGPRPERHGWFSTWLSTHAGTVIGAVGAGLIVATSVAIYSKSSKRGKRRSGRRASFLQGYAQGQTGRADLAPGNKRRRLAA